MMGDQKFLKSLLEFDKDSLGDKQVKRQSWSSKWDSKKIWLIT